MSTVLLAALFGSTGFLIAWFIAALIMVNRR